MDLRWLEDFISIANTGNFSQSARQRNVTQPTFSRRIKSLEELLGTPLIDRSSYPVKLTPSGHAFRETAEQVIQMIELAKADFRNEQAARTAALKFSALHAIALTYFPTWINEVKLELGIGSTRMEAGNLHEVVETLLNGNCDFLLCYAHEAVPILLDPKQYPAKMLKKEPFVPVCAPNDKGQPQFNLESGAGVKIPFLGYSLNNFLSRIVEHVVAKNQLAPRLSVVHEDPMAESLRRMALQGHGVSWLPLSLIENDLKAGRLVRCAGSDFQVELDIKIFRSVDRSRSTVMKLWNSIS